MEPTILTAMDYRGHHIDFYDDPDGNQAYAYWQDRRIDFGSMNSDYVGDMKKVIDRTLDTVQVFIHGVRLEQFKNGRQTDFRLVYRGRCLKVYLAEAWSAEQMLSDAEDFLEKFFEASDEK